MITEETFKEGLAHFGDLLSSNLTNIITMLVRTDPPHIVVHLGRMPDEEKEQRDKLPVKRANDNQSDTLNEKLDERLEDDLDGHLDDSLKNFNKFDTLNFDADDMLIFQDATIRLTIMYDSFYAAPVFYLDRYAPHFGIKNVENFTRMVNPTSGMISFTYHPCETRDFLAQFGQVEPVKYLTLWWNVYGPLEVQLRMDE